MIFVLFLYYISALLGAVLVYIFPPERNDKYHSCSNLESKRIPGKQAFMGKFACRSGVFFFLFVCVLVPTMLSTVCWLSCWEHSLCMAFHSSWRELTRPA